MTKTIEVCIPVRNEKKRIVPVLSALRAQTFKDFAVRIYDNGSDDGTVDLARKFQNDFDLEISTRTRNIGQNNNVNRSFANCTSPFVALLSGNDIVAENYLAALFAQLDSNPSAVCAHAKEIRIDEDGRPAGRQFSSFSSVTDDDPVNRACTSIAIYGKVCQFFALYRRSALERARPQPYSFGGDHVMACEIALYGKVLYADDTLMKCGRSPGEEESLSARIRHLLKVFSMDWERGLPANSRLGRFEHFTPTLDMFHAHLDMFRLADIPHEMRERLIVQGTRALFRRWGRRINGDIQRIVPVLRAVSNVPQSGDLLGQVLLFHALRKADECLLLVRSPELVEIRNKLSRLLETGIKPAEVSAAQLDPGVDHPE
jgi:glycosyltransferase involved in cell wall biosynthesis